ncbi:hypothetical protein BD414DRAFT_534364 [Trametes punicea]|nr:hypothetical protein BD414DRAFT_534364 [Trametes punicea]
MSRILEDNRHEYPFPRMDSFRSSSPSSGSLPSRSDSSHSRSLHSASGSGSPVPRSRRDREPDSIRSGVSSKLLSRLLPRDVHDTRSLHTILAVTTDRLESETRRADEAERRLLEVLRKLRAAHEATMLAQADAARAREELTLYKYRLEDAQREMARAQEIINELEQEKLEAEADAARARSTARRYREQQLVARAREEGRQAGFQEGFSRGKDLGYQEALNDEIVEDVDDRGYQKRPVVVEEVEDEEGEIAPSRYRAGTPAPDFRSRTPASDIRIRTPAPEMQEPIPGPTIASYRPPSSMTQSRTGQWDQPRVPDAAHHAATLPVPTLTTPVNLPSPSHSQRATPVPMPRPSSRPVRPDDVPPPIPIQEPIPSGLHPPNAMPPDDLIPYEDRGGEISIPPPHEFSRSMTPASMAPIPPPGVMQPPPITSDELRSQPDRYLYTNPNASQSGPVFRSNVNRPFSPESKASTSISQFELVAPRSKSRSSKAREDRVPTSPRGPRPREDLPPIRPEMRERQDTQDTTTTSKSSDRNVSPTSPLERVFKRRYRSRPSKEIVVPEIVVQSPSTPTSSRSSTKSRITEPHLLSPENISRPLPPQDEVIVMRMEIPGYHPMVPSGPYIPPRVDEHDEPPVVPPSPEGQFPPGFVPLTPPMPPGSPSGSPLPIPSHSPLPVPARSPLPIPPNNPLPVPPNNPLPIPSRSPLPIMSNSPRPVAQNDPPPVPQKDPVPVPHNDPIPIPHEDPVPIPHDEPLPVPHRSGTPRSPRYAEAPIPSGVVYPSPPSRRSRTPGSLMSSPPGSRHAIRSPLGERLSPLPLQFFAPLRSDTNTE